MEISKMTINELKELAGKTVHHECSPNWLENYVAQLVEKAKRLDELTKSRFNQPVTKTYSRNNDCYVDDLHYAFQDVLWHLLQYAYLSDKIITPAIDLPQILEIAF